MKRRLFVLCILSFALISCAKKRNNKVLDEHGNDVVADNQEFFTDEVRATPYIPSDQDDLLVRCAYADTNEKSCTINEMPPLGMYNNPVTVDDILGRTLVSHRFLGDNFKAALLELNSEILMKLFGSVTTIVLSDKVQSSLYFRTSGSIFVKASYLWRTLQEKDAISPPRDSRGATAQTQRNGRQIVSLPFRFYEYDIIPRDSNSTVYRDIKSSSDSNRSMRLLALSLYRVLVHELTHANDLLPRSVYRRFNEQDKMSKFGHITHNRQMNRQRISQNLTHPMRSPLLYSYAGFFYANEQLNNHDDIANTTYDAVVQEFDSDFVTSDYSYYTSSEDLAMMMEKLIPLSDKNIESIIALVEFPSYDFEVPQNYTYPVNYSWWNRILIPRIYERAKHAANMIFNDLDADYFDQKLQGQGLYSGCTRQSIVFWDIFTHPDHRN